MTNSPYSSDVFTANPVPSGSYQEPHAPSGVATLTAASLRQVDPFFNAPQNDGDDASDISMSAETEDSDDDTDGHATLQIITPQIHVQMSPPEQITPDLSKKRKMSYPQESLWIHSKEGSGGSGETKRVKMKTPPDPGLNHFRTIDGCLPKDRSLLPAEIWQHIFTFTPPRGLGCLLQVNKVFRGYVDPSFLANCSVVASLSSSTVSLRDPDVIWQLSRRLYRPWMPSPLAGLNEIDMWRLICTSKCQYCGRKALPNLTLSDQWHSGPGENGVRPIWAFAIRSCGSCLQQRTVKEIDLLLSSSVPSPLMAALPFIFLTETAHLIPPTILQQGQPPSAIKIAKYFFKPQIEDIKQEFFRVKSLGSGTAEEWVKGLDQQGKDRKADASRWDRWEAAGGEQRMRSSDLAKNHELTVKSAMQTTPVSQTNGAPPALPSGLSRTPMVANNLFQQSNGPFKPVQAHVPPFIPTPPRFDSPAQTGFGPFPQRPFQPTRQERTREEVVELKAARRAEIERRCLALDPPILPGVLAHMGSFQAAIQIIKPFDDNAWELLKPRLLAQRSEAQQRENDRIQQQTRMVQERNDERQQQGLQLREPKDGAERDWEDAQIPLRQRIAGYADEIIRDGWGLGGQVNKENSPRFAADVLTYTRKRFYAEIAKEQAAARAAGHPQTIDPPSGPFTQMLTLENMKWVYDMKVKPHTEQYRKELFLCNGCENNFKFYGFEGVIQHYAAKHTSALSVGSIVVHWRAEWPEYPPFNPEPGSGKNGHQPLSTNNTFFQGGTPLGPTYGGYPSVSGPPPVSIQVQQHPGYQQGPDPYYGHPQFGEQYSEQQVVPQTGPYVPPAQYQGQEPPHSFQEPQYQGSLPRAFPQYSGYSQAVPDGMSTNAPAMTYVSPQSSHTYPVSATGHQTQQDYNAPHSTSVSQVIPQVFQYSEVQPNTGIQPIGIRHTEAYKTQLQDVAKFAREIWNKTSGIKDLAGSVRVYVILYHMLERFRAKYATDPSLAMLIDGLSNCMEMRPVRNVNGLFCKACALEKEYENTNLHGFSSNGSALPGMKSFSLPQLFNHFQTKHNKTDKSISQDDHGLPPKWDWTKDMILLPEKARIAALAQNTGVDSLKIELVREAVPEAFCASPSPSPVNSTHPEPAIPTYSYDRAEELYEQLAPSQDNHEKYYTTTQNKPLSPDPRHFPAYQERPAVGSNSYVPLSPSQNQEHFVAYQDQSPIAYVEQRVPHPGNVRPAGGYSQQPLQDDGHFYAGHSVQHLQQLGYETNRGREARGPKQLPPDYGPRGERGYVRDVSLPRLIEATTRLAGQESLTRNQDLYPASSNIDSPRGTIGPFRQTSFIGQSERDPPSRPENYLEDSELRARTHHLLEGRNTQTSIEAGKAAERFLNNLLPVDSPKEPERRNQDPVRASRDYDRAEGLRRTYQNSPVHMQENMVRIINDDYPASGSLAINSKWSPQLSATRPLPDRAPVQRQVAPYEYDDHYGSHTREVLPRGRSPELVDHRYSSNIVYGDERTAIHRAPSRAIGYEYETTRKDNDRQRSRSPVYIKVDSMPAQYRERSPVPRYLQQEPVYHKRVPQAQAEELGYERVPRQEYYRVYADEPRSRQLQYESPVEYIQMSDALGDYVIRRPVRREEPVYTTYTDESIPPRQAVYEARAPVSRTDPAYYEEYDPRNPAPLPQNTARQPRY